MFDPLTQLSQRNLSLVNIIPNVQTHFNSEEFIPLLEAIPSETILWLQEPMMIIDRYQETFERLSSLKVIDVDLEQHILQRFIKEKQFTPTHKFISGINSMRWVSEGDQHEFFKPLKTIAFKMKSQRSFNKNFPLLIEDLKSKTAEG